MIKDAALWERWERETQLRLLADFRRNLRLLEAMYEEAWVLGLMAVPPALEGLEEEKANHEMDHSYHSSLTAHLPLLCK